MTSDIKKLLDEARERLAIEHNGALRYFENASFDQVYKNGFDANKEIIVELVEALEIEMGNCGTENSERVLAKVEARLRGSEG